jgi:hypothetical protein
MSNLSKYFFFKPVLGGYIWRMPPNARVFGPGVHLFVDEGQKAAIIRTMDSVPFFPILGCSWAVLSVLFVTAALWVAQSPRHTALLIASSVLLALYGAALISRRLLSSRLRPIVDGLPTTGERITAADIRNMRPPVILSPTRLRIVKICFILMPFILMSLLISRAVDMHQETHRPMLEALYLANADFGGVTIIFTLGVFLFGGLMFVRRKWPGQQTS